MCSMVAERFRFNKHFVINSSNIESLKDKCRHDIQSIIWNAGELTDVILNFPNITSLHCYRNKITDLSIVSGMKNLRSLCCNDNLITDLSPLTSLTKLKVLKFQNNRVTDLSPLANLVLVELNCADNPIKNLDQFFFLKNSLQKITCDVQLLKNEKVVPKKKAVEKPIKIVVEFDKGVNLSYKKDESIVEHHLELSSSLKYCVKSGTKIRMFDQEFYLVREFGEIEEVTMNTISLNKGTTIISCLLGLPIILGDTITVGLPTNCQIKLFRGTKIQDLSGNVRFTLESDTLAELIF